MIANDTSRATGTVAPHQYRIFFTVARFIEFSSLICTGTGVDSVPAEVGDPGAFNSLSILIKSSVYSPSINPVLLLFSENAIAILFCSCYWTIAYSP